jgi:hypothetical protein
MNKQTHTPGPWEVTATLEIRSTSEEHILIAGTFYSSRAGHGQTKANALLIAAAPDLLKQLKALVVQIKHAGLIVPPNVTAAIDKAEGRA